MLPKRSFYFRRIGRKQALAPEKKIQKFGIVSGRPTIPSFKISEIFGTRVRNTFFRTLL